MIKTIICSCGVETDDFYGYPDDALYCKTCYAKSQISYFKQMMKTEKETLERIQNTISGYEHEIKKYEGWIPLTEKKVLPDCVEICADPDLMIDAVQRKSQLKRIDECPKRKTHVCRWNLKD